MLKQLAAEEEEEEVMEINYVCYVLVDTTAQCLENSLLSSQCNNSEFNSFCK